MARQQARDGRGHAIQQVRIVQIGERGLEEAAGFEKIAITACPQDARRGRGEVQRARQGGLRRWNAEGATDQFIYPLPDGRGSVSAIGEYTFLFGIDFSKFPRLVANSPVRLCAASSTQ